MFRNYPHRVEYFKEEQICHSEMSCHSDDMTKLFTVSVPWVMVVCVCMCLCVFPTGLSKVLPQLYVFRPSLFLCNVKCSVLTLTGSSATCNIPPSCPLPPFLSFHVFLLFTCCLSVCRTRSHSLLHILIFWTHACYACLIRVQRVTP